MNNEPLSSKRIRVINIQIKELHSDVSDLSESLIDREPKEALEYIENLKNKLDLLKDQIVNGSILKKYRHK